MSKPTKSTTTSCRSPHSKPDPKGALQLINGAIFLCCPACGSTLVLDDEGLECDTCLAPLIPTADIRQVLMDLQAQVNDLLECIGSPAVTLVKL